MDTIDNLVVITSYFNPMNYKKRRENYDLFMEGMTRVGVKCITVECAFEDQKFELDDSLGVIKIRCNTLLWQKERLLNLAASWLPETCKYVAWLDCDIIFHDKKWATKLVSVLQTFKVAQVWETCERKPEIDIPGYAPDLVTSFAATMATNPNSLNAGRYDKHGHTGYGWAMHREIFDEVGLYEFAVGGSSDHFMSHAIFGDCNFCIQNALKKDVKQIEHFKEWAYKFHNKVNGSLGVVKCHIHHLWHGEIKNRRYFLRMHDLVDHKYDPFKDIQVSPGKPLEWAPTMQKEGLKNYFYEYFSSRQEDGTPV